MPHYTTIASGDVIYLIVTTQLSIIHLTEKMKMVTRKKYTKEFKLDARGGGGEYFF